MCFYCELDIVHCHNCHHICCEYCGENFQQHFTINIIKEISEKFNRDEKIDGVHQNFIKEHSQWCLGEIKKSKKYYYCSSCENVRRKKRRQK